MHDGKNSVLLIAMPFAGLAIPSIQLPLLQGYLTERDIIASTKHLYIKAAEFYGINNYHCLITRPNESYTAQMVFSKYVFPNHWQQNQERFRDYFQRMVASHSKLQNNLTYEDYVDRTDRFVTWVLENVDWNSYDIIGFTLNYGQFLPSLAIAKKIKELAPEKTVVFGGSRTVGELGIRVLRSFDYIDCIVSGEGEEALYQLAFDLSNTTTIPNLIYRDHEQILWNKTDKVIDMNSLPFPQFEDFYNDLWSTNDEVTQYFLCHGRLPVEICRGCWWNQCTFCNYNVQHPCYREKSVKRIVDEIVYLSDTYTMLNFQIIGNTFLKKEYRLLLEELKNIRRDFNFFTETRAGQLKREDYRLLKEAGFTNIQTGIESFSQSYLKKINKGTRVIDNIAALKFCKEFGITNEYNLIVDYPNEEKIDFEETQHNIQHIKHYLDPPHLNRLLVGYGSAIFHHPEAFNISAFEYTEIDRVMYPQDILDRGISFYYSFKKKEDVGNNNWNELIEQWKMAHIQPQEMTT